MSSPYVVSFRNPADSKPPTDHIPDSGQVERMNRTIKDATVKRYFSETHDQLRAYLRDFVDPANFAGRIGKAWDVTASQIHDQSASANAGTYTETEIQ